MMPEESASTLREQAIGWVALMDSDDWSAEREADLQRWLAGGPRRRGALLEVQAGWAVLMQQGTGTAPAATIALPPVATSRRGLVVGGLAAGSALAAATMGIMFLGGAETLSTVRGEIRQVPLPDGSVAAINTDSTIAMRYESDRRKISVAKGEAWFQVAKNKARPFLVEVGPIRVLAVGTAFSVRRRETGADIQVTEGTVDLWSEAGSSRMRLTEGQGVFLSYDAGTVRPTDAAALDNALAWRSGRIELAQLPLRDAVAEFNRYNRRQLVVVDQALAGRKLDGLFRTDDVEGFARAVGATLNVPVSLDDPHEIRLGGYIRTDD